jgi:hypothetical protein
MASQKILFVPNYKQDGRRQREPGGGGVPEKYTPVSDSFIDEFLSMYTLNSRPTDFVVDLAIAARWMSVLKGNLKKTLAASYTRGIDYEITLPPADGSFMERGDWNASC